MSALGIWNNRYEGGPCYAACMETFTLYLHNNLAIILPFNIAGKAAITELAELMTHRAEMKRLACANVILVRPCGPELENFNQSKI